MFLMGCGWKQCSAWSKPFVNNSARGGSSGPYLFQRTAREAMDSLPIRGFGNPVLPVGMICSAFRPSDDATIFPLLIPSNLFAVRSLRQLEEILEAPESCPPNWLRIVGKWPLKWNGLSSSMGFTNIRGMAASTAYEVDGFGGRVFMDDANVPRPALAALPGLLHRG